MHLHLDDVATTAGTRSLISPGFIARTVGVKNRCKSAIAVLAAVNFKVAGLRNDGEQFNWLEKGQQAGPRMGSSSIDVKDIPQVGPLQWGWIRSISPADNVNRIN